MVYLRLLSKICEIRNLSENSILYVHIDQSQLLIEQLEKKFKDTKYSIEFDRYLSLWSQF